MQSQESFISAFLPKFFQLFLVFNLRGRLLPKKKLEQVLFSDELPGFSIISSASEFNFPLMLP